MALYQLRVHRYTPSCLGPMLLGSSIDYIEDPHLAMLTVTTGYPLSKDMLRILLAFLGVETVNRLNMEQLDVAA